MIVPVKTLATITASSTGGRNGHSETSDKLVSVDLSVPKSMGGPGKPNTVTPEHVFAAGYAACFGGAVDFIAKALARAKAAASASSSISKSRTRAWRRPTSRRSCARRTRRSAPIRMRRAATWR